MKGMLFKPDVWKAKLRVLNEYGEAQTRRVIKLDYDFHWYIIDSGDIVKMLKNDIGDCVFIKPRYQVGEVVYIKEACQLCRDRGGDWDKTCYPIYKSDLSPKDLTSEECDWDWLSPLFMPSWAARYFIEITGLKPQRLQDITYEDAQSEGIGGAFIEGIARYAWLWNSINPKYPWESNPWVWVYEFKNFIREV